MKPWHKHQKLCRALCSFLATVLLLNSLTDAARAGRFWALSAISSASPIGMLLVLPLWFMRLLFQTHECINHPMAAS